jgi:hypothetical protein
MDHFIMKLRKVRQFNYRQWWWLLQWW